MIQVKPLKYFGSTIYLKGYSLVEISIALLVIGIITGTMLKGKDLIDSARLDSVVNDIRSIQMAYTQYVNTYSAIPGNDKNINKINQNIPAGSGNGKFSKEDASRVFKHLNASGLIESENFKLPKVGSMYSIVEKNGHPYLQLSSLSNKQTNLLKTKLLSNFGTDIDIIVEGESDTISVAVKID